MKNRIKSFLTKYESKLMSAVTVVTVATTYVVVTSTASAAGASASDIAGLVAKILGGGATIMGAIRLVTGFVSYASAQDDSNGAEMRKAEGKFSAGVILGAVGLLIIGMSGTIAGWMTL